MIGELKKIANTPHSPILIKWSAGVDDSGQESGVHPDSDVDARVHEWDEAVEALVDCFALAGSSMDNRVSVGAKAKLPRELREVREERCLRNLPQEVALNDQPLPVNVRGDSSERRLVHATLTLMRSPAGGGLLHECWTPASEDHLLSCEPALQRQLHGARPLLD